MHRDFVLMKRMYEKLIRNPSDPKNFDDIKPVTCITDFDPQRAYARHALVVDAEALRAGRVGLFLVAGGQGTRLGFDGPKGSYPIGGLTGKSLFQYHAEKIISLQHRYRCVLPWYIMVSRANSGATQAFFEDNDF